MSDDLGVDSLVTACSMKSLTKSIVFRQLHIASVHGCEKAVSTLIRVCPEKAWLDMTNDYGHTPLHLAVMSGNAVVAKMLLIAGASLAVRDYTGETPVHKATEARHMECLKALLTHQPKKLSSILDQRNYNGESNFQVAFFNLF